jgi:UDP-2,3-diacylglucosamine pyrophosphatase LpxH
LIIVASDVHLGYEHADKPSFMSFLNEIGGTLGQTDHLILLGDIFDFWRRNNVSVLLENEDVIEKLESFSTKIHYIPGNHDFTFARLNPMGTVPFNIEKTLKLQDAGRAFTFIHGYQLEVLTNFEPLTIEEYEDLCFSLCQRTGDFLGDLLSFLWDSIHLSFKRGDKRRDMVQAVGDVPERRRDMHKIDRLARSPAKDIFLGLGKTDRVIFGHTHRPFLEKLAANAGCWVLDASMKNTYLKIENGEMNLLQYDPK